jgi:hypothetical protein
MTETTRLNLEFTRNGQAASAKGSTDSFRIQIGEDFGAVAEIYVDTKYGDDTPEIEVSFPAIGAHSPEVALGRVEVYRTAAEFADTLDELARAANYSVPALADFVTQIAAAS